MQNSNKHLFAIALHTYIHIVGGPTSCSQIRTLASPNSVSDIVGRQNCLNLKVKDIWTKVCLHFSALYNASNATIWTVLENIVLKNSTLSLRITFILSASAPLSQFLSSREYIDRIKTNGMTLFFLPKVSLICFAAIEVQWCGVDPTQCFKTDK